MIWSIKINKIKKKRHVNHHWRIMLFSCWGKRGGGGVSYRFNWRPGTGFCYCRVCIHLYFSTDYNTLSEFLNHCLIACMNLWWNCTHSGAKKFHIGVRVIHAWIQKNKSYLKEWIIQYQSNLYKYKLDWGSIRLSLFSYKLGSHCFHSWQFNIFAIPS